MIGGREVWRLGGQEAGRLEGKATLAPDETKLGSLEAGSREAQKLEAFTSDQLRRSARLQWPAFPETN